MKIIYRAGDLSEAHIIAGLLEANGIDSHVGGHYLQGGIGELAATDFATVHVADDDVASAKAIIAEYEEKNKYLKNTAEKKRNIYAAPLIVIALSLLLILILTIIFSEQ